MSRFLILSVTLLVATHSVPAADPMKTIKVEGQLSGGFSVTAVCTVGKTGAIAGTGKLSGKKGDGTTFSYAFKVETFSTAKGKLVLGGHFKEANGGAVTLTSSVPSGPQTFTYFAAGSNHSASGKGTVTVQ